MHHDRLTIAWITAILDVGRLHGGIKRDPEMNDTMEIIVNGHSETVPASSTLSFLIHHYKEYDGDLIVEHNGRFVYPQKYAEIAVQEGDTIEFINPNIGG